MNPLSDAVIVALITGACAVVSQIIISHVSSKDLFAELNKRLAVVDTKLEELTREVRAHNNFAQRLPVLEEKVSQLERKGA